MKHQFTTAELLLLTLMSALISCGVALLTRAWVPPYCSAPTLQILLTLLYTIVCKPRIENLRAGTICEPTQKDCYNCEDEREATQR